VIALTPEANVQLGKFEVYYIEQQRPQALQNLGHALAEASLVILNVLRAAYLHPARTRSWIVSSSCG